MLGNKYVQSSPRNTIRVLRNLAELYGSTKAEDGKINETLLKADTLARNLNGISPVTKLQLRLERIQSYAKKESTREMATQLAKETLSEQKSTSLHNGPEARIYARIQVRRFFMRCTQYSLLMHHFYAKHRPFYAKLFSHRKITILSSLNQKAYMRLWKHCTAPTRRKSLNVRSSKEKPVLPLDGQRTPPRFYEELDLTNGCQRM